MTGFADNASRVRHRAALAARIEAITVTQPRAHWLALLEANDIPCGPINDYAQVFADPQVLAREMVVETEHPTLGHLRTLGSPIKMSATPPDVSPPRAAARRAHRRSADGGRVQRRGDRGIAGSRRDHLSARFWLSADCADVRGLDRRASGAGREATGQSEKRAV